MLRAPLLAGVIFLAVANAAHASGYQDFNQGVAAYMHGDYAGAVQLLTRALSEPDLPDHLKPVAYLERGEAFLAAKKYDPAIADYTSALQVKPDYFLAWLKRATAESAKGNYLQAIADDTQAQRLRPMSPMPILDRIAVYRSVGRYADELADCNTLLATVSTDTTILLLRSDAYRYLGQYDAAIKDASTVIHEDRKSDSAYGARGRAYQLKGDFKDALDDYEDALDLNADLLVAKWGKAYTLLDMGRFADAQDTFAQILKSNPKLSEAALGIALVHMRSGASPVDELTKASAALDADAWPGPIVGLVLGKSTPEQVRAASTRGNPATLAERQCAANFYIGEWQLFRGDVTSAQSSLQNAATACPPDIPVAESARVELNRILHGGKSWADSMAARSTSQ